LFLLYLSRCSSVGTATSLRAGPSRVCITAGKKDFPFLQNVRRNSGAHPPGVISKGLSDRGVRLTTPCSRLRLKCRGTRAETRFRLSAKRTSPFKSAGASVQSTTGSRGVRISSSNTGYTVFRGSVKSIGYPLHSPVSLSLPLQCVTVCHHISTGLYRGA